MARKAKKLEPITIRLEPDVRAALERIAESDDRSLAWVINRALREWLEDGSKDAGPGFLERRR